MDINDVEGYSKRISKSQNKSKENTTQITFKYINKMRYTIKM